MEEGDFELLPEVDQSPERKLTQILDDPRDLRTEFLKLPHTEKAALIFLNKIGVWDTYTSRTITSEGSRIGSAFPDWELDGAFGHRYLRKQSVLPLELKELWQEQKRWKRLLRDPDALRRQFTTPPRHDDARAADREAFAMHTKLENTLEIHLECKKGQHPLAIVQPLTLHELLIATAWLDVIQQEKVQVCQRKDCGLPFTGRVQRYCSPSCAHLMAVRAFREREKSRRAPRKLTRTRR